MHGELRYSFFSFLCHTLLLLLSVCVPCVTLFSLLFFTEFDCRTTKVEGMLAISRLATFHPSALAKEIHTVILALVYEVKNLRSTVARTAIFTLGDLLVKMKRYVEPVSFNLMNWWMFSPGLASSSSFFLAALH